MNHSSAVRLYGALHAKTVQQICTTRNFQLTFSRTLEINSEPHVPHQLAPPLKEETCILFEHGHVHKRTVDRIYGLKIIILYSYLSSAMFMIFSVTRNPARHFKHGYQALSFPFMYLSGNGHPQRESRKPLSFES